MHSTGLAAPAAAAQRDAPGIRRVPLAPSSGRPSRRPSYDRVQAGALVASVLLHLLVLLVSPLLIRVGLPPGFPGSPFERVTGREEIQLIIPVVVEGAPDVPARVAEAQPDVRETTPVRAAPRQGTVTPRPGAAAPAPGTPSARSATPQTGPATSRDGRSVSERLQPGIHDPRLYVNPRDLDHPTREATQHQRYMEHFEARIDRLNDSLYATTRGPDTDWTVKDKDGKRWGLSEEGLHLGGVTIPPALIPRPGPTGDNAKVQAEREAQRQREEIQRQEADRARREAQEESNAETRARRDAERPKPAVTGS